MSYHDAELDKLQARLDHAQAFTGATIVLKIIASILLYIARNMKAPL